MKATGMVRRMDELGRVVIPKEIRRTMHLHEGEELEIYAKDEGLFMKKYSSLSALEGCADEYIAGLGRLVRGDVMVADLDRILSGKGTGSELTPSLLAKMQMRVTLLWREPMAVCRQGDRYDYGMLCPLLVHGDLYGALVLGNASPVDERDQIAMNTATALLVRRLGD